MAGEMRTRLRGMIEGEIMCKHPNVKNMDGRAVEAARKLLRFRVCMAVELNLCSCVAFFLSFFLFPRAPACPAGRELTVRGGSLEEDADLRWWELGEARV